jgi:hypothetical protein
MAGGDRSTAQQPAMPVIGFLGAQSAEDSKSDTHGYDGRNLAKKAPMPIADKPDF